jgi:hypothetical protein
MLILKVLSVLFCTLDTCGAFRNVFAVRKKILPLRGGMRADSFTGLQQDSQIGSGNFIPDINPREITTDLKGLSLGMVNASADLVPALEQGGLATDPLSVLPLNASDERNLLRLQLRVAQVKKKFKLP